MFKTVINILLVEDNPGDARLISEMLNKSGKITYTVKFAEKISSAISVLREYKFDIIILDLNLPDSSGLESLDVVIKNTGGLIPVIVLTGIKDEDTGIASIERGAEDYLVKGETNPTLMMRSIRYGIERKKAEEALAESENKYRTLIQATPCIISSVKPDGTTLFVNDYIRIVTGYSAEEIIGQNWWDLFYPGELRDQVAGFFESSKSGNVRGYEMTLTSRDGSARTILWDSFHKFGSDNQLIEINGAGIDITARKLAETALMESERRLKEAQTMARLGDWEFDLTTQKITWSDQVFRMYERDPLIGPPTREEEAEYYTPEQSALLQRAVKQAIDTGNSVDYEFMANTESGRTLVFAGSMRPVKDAADNVIKIFGTLQDITERNKILENLRTSLDEKKELIREIYHRTKNNLQVIISMFTLQSIFSSDEKLGRLFKDMENRIRAMSLVHEKLYQSKDMSRLDLKDYLSELLNNIISGYGIKENTVLITNKMENIEVLIDTAIPCGLIFNELISNVARHAFPGGKKGELDISLVMDKTGKIELIVADNGDGKGSNPDIKNAESMGFQIISNIVEYQLQGEYELDTSAGIKWTISFKDNIYTERI